MKKKAIGNVYDNCFKNKFARLARQDGNSARCRSLHVEHRPGRNLAGSAELTRATEQAIVAWTRDQSHGIACPISFRGSRV